MAKDKKGFLMYADQLSLVKKLVEKDREKGTNNAGELFLHLLEYVNDEEPVPVNDIVELSFEPMKMQLKRDLKKWDKTKEVKSESGALGNLKRYAKDLYDEVKAGKMELEKAVIVAKDRRASQTVANVAVTVNDNVNVTVNDINKNNPLWIPIEKLEKIMLAESSWHVTAHRDLKITIEQVKSWIGRFVLKLEAEGETGKTLKDSKSYFIRWTKIELTKPENKSQTTLDTKQPAQKINPMKL